MKLDLYKYRYQLIILLLILFNICIVIKNSDNYLMSEHVLVTNNNENKIEFSDGKYNKYKLLVYYPKTEYKVLNNAIYKEINSLTSYFKSIAEKENNIENQYYTLNIFYEEYNYKNNLCYVFHAEYYLGGAHPNHNLWTICYNKEKNDIVTIDKLIEKRPNILNILSNYCRKALKDNPKILNYSILFDGTKAEKSKFKNFIFSDKGLIIFFERYSIASYNAGEFSVIVPYNSL